MSQLLRFKNWQRETGNSKLRHWSEMLCPDMFCEHEVVRILGRLVWSESATF